MFTKGMCWIFLVDMFLLMLLFRFLNLSARENQVQFLNLVD